MTPETTGDLLRAVGELLHGPDWVTAMAQDLNISRRRMERFAAGKEVPRDTILPELLDMLMQQERDLEEQLALLRRQEHELSGLVERIRRAIR